ncbi:PVC-type heme-binding CxxCH protein [Dyadobacter frigoris]|uniref:Dehydrogenase n=1 Tax=Dyadobacter frigoris TaxID=2576211 RepID=A0A4U6CW83_9BACT|nr:PVC-type heme-binding CxxCH protein [Dyadobacter frigoris]TKT87947.1 dehydrogenase [Dyadobacter frigoris]
MKFLSACSLMFILLICICCKQKHYADALTPEEALKSFELDENFNIEIFAAEPIVKDPVEMVFDEQGRAFVVEMPDYPYKPENGKGSGRIKMLVDTNGDNRMDKYFLFADSLLEATSILPWKGGLLVAAAPNIWYMKDTTGDFKADIKEILFTGFFAGNSEAQITNLRFGIDNWIYASNHGQDGQVTFSKKPGSPALPMKNADFRFRLDRNQFEPETGPGQFGHTFDDFGHRFVTQNTIRIQHMVVPWRYLHRHDFLPSQKGMADISNGELTMFQRTAAPYWRAERSARRNKEYKEQQLDRIEYADGHFTGATGGTFYGGNTFPEKYSGNIFTGDVSGNLVHRDVITSLTSSPTFAASRDSIHEKNKEFLSSTDSWFRPANLTSGADGALYVIDMYRQHIETPVSIPEDLKTDMDFLAGVDKGRIYKITPKTPRSATPALVNPARLNALEIVKLLSDPSQFYRLQAQRILLERQDKTIVPAVIELFSNGSDPRTRLHAFFVLEGLSALNEGLIQKAVNDPSPGVREYGLIPAEKYPGLLPEIIKRTTDGPVRVAFQATLSLGEFPVSKSGAALVNIINNHFKDAWFRKAVLSSDPGISNEFIKKLAVSGFFSNAESEKLDFIKDLSQIKSARNQNSEMTVFLNLLADPSISKNQDWMIFALNRTAQGIKTSKIKSDPTLLKLLENISKNASQKIKTAAQQVLTASKGSTTPL